MNKKFSTLVGCLLFGTAFSAVAQQVNFPATDPYTQVKPGSECGIVYRSFGTNSAVLGNEVNAIDANKWYQLRATNEEGVEGVLIQERDFQTGEVTLRIIAKPADAPLNYSLWKIAYNKADGVTGGKFTFVNKETGLGIVFDHTTAYTKDEVGVNSPVISNTNASILEGCNTEWSWFSTNKVTSGTLSDKVLYAQVHDGDQYIVLKPVVGNPGTAANANGLGISGPQVVAVVYTAADAGDGATACNALKLTPVEANPIVLGAKDINRMIDAQKDGAAGFLFKTPAGIGHRELMDPVDNSTLNTYKYIAKEDYSVAEALEAMAKNADKVYADNAADAKRLADENYSYWNGDYNSNVNWNVDGAESETKNAVLAAKKQYDAAKTNADLIKSAKTLLNAIESAYTANTSWTSSLDTESQYDGQSYGKRIDASVNKVNQFTVSDDLATQIANLNAEAAIARQFPIRLNAQISATDKDKYLMVDTARWEEATELPSNSPALKLSNKKPDGKEGIYVDARYNFRLTYYPTQDSLLIEPLNASVMTDAEYAAKTLWKNSIVARKFIYSNDITTANKGLSASNTMMATEPAQAPVAVMLRKLYDGKQVVTAGATDKVAGYPGTLHTCIEFDHTYPTLVRGTVAEGVYLINLATNLQPNTYSHRVDGTNIVADMKGHVIYDEQEKSQDFTHMPAAQWVVEWVGCKEDFNKGTARVKIVNREYANVAFEGQLYKASENKIYFINHNYNNYLANHNYGGNTQFACSDTLVFIPVDPANTLGYLNPGDQVIENTFKLRQFFNYGDDPYYLNAVKVGSDTILRAQNEGSNFELIPAFESYVEERTKKDGSKQKFTISPENIPFGYTSEAAGAPQLYKSIYKLKVKDADKINNDRMFVGVNKNGKYCVADTLDNKYPEYTVAYFALKENNHWPMEGDDNHYYSLVEVDYWYPEIIYDEDNDNWNLKWTVYDDVKLAIEQGQLDAKQEDLCQDRTEAFALEADTMPYYRRLAGLEYTEFYSVNNNNRVLFEKDGFMSIHSTAEETADNKLYVDTAWVSGTSMPTYLLARDVNKFITDTCQHGDHPEASAHWRKVEYLQGRYMIDLGSINAKAIPSYVDTKPYAQMYSKYAFVNAIHMADTLYIMKAATDSIKYQHELTIDKKKVQFALPMKKEVLNGATVAFRLKNHENDVTKGEFYVETKGQKYGYAANGNAWMKEQNNDNIVSTASGESVDHNNEWVINRYEDIYQALLLDTDAKGGATANEEIDTPSSISVVAGNGELVVKGAAGKTITVINALGSTIAKTVASSDEEKINVAAGFVVVAVEGEAAVKAIVK